MWIYFNMFIFLFTFIVLILLIRKKSKLKTLFFFTLIILLFSINNLLLPFFNSLSKRIIFTSILLIDLLFLIDLHKNFLKLVEKLKFNIIFQIVFYFIIITGMSEGTINMLAEKNIIKLYSPLIIISKRNGDDWRMAHIKVDKSKVYDPILFWKPTNKYPYNKYSFKGKEFSKIKSNKKRIFFYGDSNTDGQDNLSYPSVFQRMTESETEIFNAGVTGWSSYQGMKRFLSEYEEWSPDIVFFSFGWNDCAGAFKVQDNCFTIPPKFMVSIQRFLLNYKFVSFFLESIKKEGPMRKEYIPRVSKVDYIKNISEILSICREKNIRLILLTRPYVYDSSFFVSDSTFIKFIPEYNETLLKFAKDNDVEIIDVQKEFEGKTHLFEDECHFNEEGHFNLSEIIYEYLK